MDAALVGEGVAADDRLVVLHRKRRHRRHQLGGAGQHRVVDLASVGQGVGPGAQRHHHLFQSGVAGALAQAVHRAFDLPGAAGETGERVGHRQPEVVVAVGGKDRLVGVGHPLADGFEHRLVLRRGGEADGVGQVDRGRAGADRHLDAAAKVVERRAGRVHRRPFDVGHEVARLRHRARDDLQHLRLALVHLMGEVDRRGRDEGVDARSRGVAHRLAASGDVALDGAGEAGHGGGLGLPGDGADRLEIADRGDGKAGLDDVDAHRVEQGGDFELALEAHGGAGGTARRRAMWCRR